MKTLYTIVLISFAAAFPCGTLAISVGSGLSVPKSSSTISTASSTKNFLMANSEAVVSTSTASGATTTDVSIPTIDKILTEKPAPIKAGEIGRTSVFLYRVIGQKNFASVEGLSEPKVAADFSSEDFSNPEIIPSFVKASSVVVPSIKEVLIDEKTIRAYDERPAKLFGFFVITYRLVAEGDIETGKIRMKKPWWLFLASDDAETFRATFEKTPGTAGKITEISGLKLQAIQEKRAKTIQTLSNILSKISKTEESLASNLK